MRKALLASIFTGLAVLPGLASTGCQTSQSREIAGCLDRAESIAYLSKIRQSIAAEWKKPSGAGGQLVVVTRVNGEGEIRNATIRVNTRNAREDTRCGDSLRCRMVEEPLRKSMEAAVRNARPVGAPPERARCMIERSIEITFETSERFVEDPELD
jgi:hypothetical protein